MRILNSLEFAPISSEIFGYEIAVDLVNFSRQKPTDVEAEFHLDECVKETNKCCENKFAKKTSRALWKNEKLNKNCAVDARARDVHKNTELRIEEFHECFDVLRIKNNCLKLAMNRENRAPFVSRASFVWRKNQKDICLVITFQRLGNSRRMLTARELSRYWGDTRHTTFVYQESRVLERPRDPLCYTSLASHEHAHLSNAPATRVHSICRQIYTTITFFKFFSIISHHFPLCSCISRLLKRQTILNKFW